MTIFNPTTIVGTANQVLANGNVGSFEAGSVTLTLPQSIGSTSTPTFSSLTLSGLTANTFLYSGTAGLLTTTIAPTNGQLLIGSTGAAPVLGSISAGTGITVTPGTGTITIAATNTGTVTSVGLALPSIFTVTNSPVTTSGTLTGTFNTQTANTFFTGPASGAAATPTFRTVGIDEMSDVVITAPTANDVLYYNGTNWVNAQTSNIPGAGRSFSGNIAATSGTSVITPDVTPPLITAGTELISQTITPLSTSSRFIIHFGVSASASTNNNIHSACLFRTLLGVSTYLGGAVQTYASGGNSASVQFIITDIPNTLSPVTYSIRYGTSANTWYINRESARITFGGVQSGWVVEEE